MRDRFAVASWRRSSQTGEGRTQPSVLARAPQRILIACIVISLIAHVAMAYVLRNQALGRVDLEALKRTSIVRPVRRAAYDPIASGSTGTVQDAGPTEAQLADALLEQESTPAPEVEAPEPEMDVRDMEDRHTPQPTTDVAMAAHAFELPEHMLNSLGGAGVGEGSGDSTGDGDGGGDGPGAGGGGEAASEAQRILMRGFGPGAGGRGAGGGLAPGQVQFEDRKTFEKGQLEPPTAPTIYSEDVVHGLEQTTQLDVPEHLDNDFTYKLTRYEPPNARGYFRVDISTRQSLKKLEAMPKDVVFLIDTSSSIPQQWVSQVIRGVEQGLGTMNDGDRFNVVMFNEQLSFYTNERVTSATNENIRQARQWLNNAESRGWTNMDAALSRLLVRDLSPERVYDIVLISDGKPTRGVVRTRRLINNITRENSNVASIYCVGVGRNQDREMLEFLAYRNKGFCRFATELSEVAPTIRDLMGQLRYPLIKDAQLRWAGAGAEKVYPTQPRNIHQGETLSVFGRYIAAEQLTMQITGRNGRQAVDFTWKRDLSDAQRGGAAIAEDWAFWKLHHLYSQIMIDGETETLKSQIDQLRREYDLRTIY